MPAIVVFEFNGQTATILDIAVKSEHQGKGIGSKLIDFIYKRFRVVKIIAETDNDAINFYKRYGFAVAHKKIEFGVERYVCMCDNTVFHYNTLIEENNDPVRDPKPLQDYMDKWDGPDFIDRMELDSAKTVLEIGVGTGRLAVRVAPLCSEFFGIDISSKTIDRARENLFKFQNTVLVCGDFLTYEFDRSFDIIYSSLTFMHIEEKQKALNKIATLLNAGGKFVLSIDKNQDGFIDTGTSRLTVFPDNVSDMKKYISNAGLTVTEHYETEFAHIFVAKKG